MIILALRGESFMKFQHLQLENVPARGLIGVEGANEAGKSTVGELIQFALFGKTLSTMEGSVLDLIHWDSDHCTVEVDFEVGAGDRAGRYRVWREMDRFGTNFARLLRIDDRKELASGVMRVQEELQTLLHFTFDDFIGSFYLAEGEPPRSPHEMRAFLDRIVGADLLAQVEEEVRGEITEHEETFARVQGEIKRNRMQIEKYLPNVAAIPDLTASAAEHVKHAAEHKAEWERTVRAVAVTEARVQARDRHRERIGEWVNKSAREIVGALAGTLDNEARLESDEAAAMPERHAPESAPRDAGPRPRESLARLAAVAAALKALDDVVAREAESSRKMLLGDGPDGLPARERAARGGSDRAAARRTRSVVCGIFTALVALVGAGACVLHRTNPELLTAWIALPDLFAVSVLGVAIAAAIVSILCFLRARRQRRVAGEHARELEEVIVEQRNQKEGLELAERFLGSSLAFDDLGSALEGCGRARIREALEVYRGALERELGSGEAVNGLVRGIVGAQERRLHELRAKLKMLRKDMQRLADLEKKELGKRERCEAEIREYQKQDGRREQLEAGNHALREEAERAREEIEVRYLLNQLLDEVVDSIRHRAGPNLGKGMRRLLPSLTGGRYSDMQVTADFRLRLFTSEKSDFLDAHELSGGTYEGLAFGFRLVFSQAFIKAVTRSPQCLFLDEPFKAMDRDRVHATLKTLMHLSPEIAQVFVVLPGISDHDRSLFDHIVRMRVGGPVARHDFATGAPIASDPVHEPAASAEHVIPGHAVPHDGANASVRTLSRESRLEDERLAEGAGPHAG